MDYTKSKNKEILRDLCERMRTLAGQLQDHPELYEELMDIERAANDYVLQSLEKVGTQKSEKRSRASRKNGKKGGRPPKEITELKRQINALQDEVDAITALHKNANDAKGKVWSFDENEKVSKLMSLKGELHGLEQNRRREE